MLIKRRRREREHDVLVVSTDGALHEQLERDLDGKLLLTRVSDPNVALKEFLCRPVAGAIVDGNMPGRLASILAKAYLEHQPVGRVVVIASAADTTTLVGLAYRDSRVAVLMRPYDPAELETVLCGAGALAAV
jgi:DNA-binding NtrC family response regulator